MKIAVIYPPTGGIRAVGMALDQLAWFGARLLDNVVGEYPRMNQTTLRWFLEEYAPYSEIPWKPIPDGSEVTFMFRKIIIDSSVKDGIVLFNTKGEGR